MLGLEGSEYGFLGVTLAALGLAAWRILVGVAAWIRPKADALVSAITDSMRVQAETNVTNSAALVQIAESLTVHGASLEECRRAVVTLAGAANDRATSESLRRIEGLLEKHSSADQEREAALAHIKEELERLRAFADRAGAAATSR